MGSSRPSPSMVCLPSRPASEPFLNRHAIGQVVAIDRHALIGEAPRRWKIVEPLVAERIDLAIMRAFHHYPLEQFMRRRFAQGAGMLEGDELARCYFAARGGAIVLEHVFQGVPKKREIVGRKPRALGELGRHGSMRRSEPISHDVLA